MKLHLFETILLWKRDKAINCIIELKYPRFAFQGDSDTSGVCVPYFSLCLRRYLGIQKKADNQILSLEDWHLFECDRTEKAVLLRQSVQIVDLNCITEAFKLATELCLSCGSRWSLQKQIKIQYDNDLYCKNE